MTSGRTLVVAGVAGLAAGACMELPPKLTFPAPVAAPACRFKVAPSPDYHAMRDGIMEGWRLLAEADRRWSAETEAFGRELGVSGADLPLALAALVYQVTQLEELGHCKPTFSAGDPMTAENIHYEIQCRRDTPQVRAARDRLVASVLQHYAALSALAQERVALRKKLREPKYFDEVLSFDECDAAVNSARTVEQPFLNSGGEYALGGAGARCSHDHLEICAVLCQRDDVEACQLLALFDYQHRGAEFKQRMCEASATGPSVSWTACWESAALQLASGDGRAGLAFVEKICALTGQRHECLQPAIGSLIHAPSDVMRPLLLELVSRHCDAGDAAACQLTESAYLGNWGVAKDTKRVQALRERSCERGVASACANLADCYDGSGTCDMPKDPVRAESYLHKACDGKLESACTALEKRRDGQK